MPETRDHDEPLIKLGQGEYEVHYHFYRDHDAEPKPWAILAITAMIFAAGFAFGAWLG